MNISTPMIAGPDGSPDVAGPPLFVSMPMFCLGDPALAAALEGVACDVGKHLGYVDVEPITGRWRGGEGIGRLVGLL